MVFIDPILEIGLIALAVVVVSKFLQSRMIDKKKQKEAQANMKEKQVKIKELMKAGDEKSKNEMDRLQKEMFEDMNATMQGTMKYMIFSMPLFFGAFFVLGFLYGGMLIEAPFVLPKFQGFFFLNPFTWVPVGWGTETGWLKWYFIIYLIASIAISIALKAREKFIKEKREENAEKVKEIIEDSKEEIAKEAKESTETSEEEKSEESTEEERKGEENAE